MTEINKGTLTKAALRSGISEKTARKYRKQLMIGNSDAALVTGIKLQFTSVNCNHLLTPYCNQLLTP